MNTAKFCAECGQKLVIERKAKVTSTEVWAKCPNWTNIFKGLIFGYEEHDFLLLGSEKRVNKYDRNTGEKVS